MFVSTAIAGPSPCSSIASSCQLDSSITTGVSGPIRSSAPSAEMPMLPATTLSGFQRVRISPIRVETVVFPFVP